MSIAWYRKKLKRISWSQRLKQMYQGEDNIASGQLAPLNFPLLSGCEDSLLYHKSMGNTIRFKCYSPVGETQCHSAQTAVCLWMTALALHKYWVVVFFLNTNHQIIITKTRDVNTLLWGFDGLIMLSFIPAYLLWPGLYHVPRTGFCQVPSSWNFSQFLSSPLPSLKHYLHHPS